MTKSLTPLKPFSPAGGSLNRCGLIAVVWICVAFSGCSMFKVSEEESKTGVLSKAEANQGQSTRTQRSSDKRQSPSPAPAAEKQEVRLDGGLQLGDTDNLAFTLEELTTILNERLEADKLNSVRSLVKLYPDLVTQLLLQANGNSMSWSRLTQVAKFFDTLWVEGDQETWQDYIKTLARDGSAQKLAAARFEFRRRLAKGVPAQALDLRLSQSLRDHTGAITAAEVYRLEAIAYLNLENDEECIRSLEESIRLLEKNHPYQASHIALLLGETNRHAGELDDWKSIWETAIDAQSQWLVEKGLNDPVFWKQATFLRPVSVKWPAPVIRRIEKSLRLENLDFDSNRTSDDEAVVWALIGTQSLKRHESQNAILAFKKSEALVTSAALKEELQMQQAIAMIDGGEPGPASPILIRLGSKPNLLGDRAKAILATLKLQNGSLAQGMNLLQSAIKTSNHWPTSERLRAQADYGLAFLMRGREKQGISLLNQVYREFVKTENFQHAAQCLENIAAYYEATDQNSKYKTTVKRIRALDSF